MAGQSVPLSGHDALTLKRTRVNRKNRLELVGAHPRRLDWYKAGGCVTEIIQYRTRLFVPLGRAEAVISKIMAQAA